MEFKKNYTVKLTIEDMGVDGEGIGKTDGFTVFVKDAVIGDRIVAKITKSKERYGYGRLMEILEPSPVRIEPWCPIAKRCGGCQLQALAYDEQLRFKEDKVRGNLQRIGGFSDPPMEPIIGMENPWRYRNKAQFPVGRDKNGRIISGFYAGRTHDIIECDDCLLGLPVNRQIMEIVLEHMRRFNVPPYDEKTGKGLVRHVLIRCGFHTGEVMVCLILNGNKIDGSAELVEKLRAIPGMTGICINVNKERSNVILGNRIIEVWGKSYITDRLKDITYKISPLSFYQVNPIQTEKLYQKVLEYADLKGTETVWDLYCGIGTISLFLARDAGRVRGVEIIPAAIENAIENAALNEIDNAEFFVGKAEDVLPERYALTGERADVIVVDPPRKGCDQKLLETMVTMAPQKIVYVSCDSATLARDLKYLCGNGYALQRVCPVEQFAQTVHVETVVLLGRKMVDAPKHVTIDYDVPTDINFTHSATYVEIKAWIKEHYNGMKVSSLYVAQIKDKHGLEKRENYNKAKKPDVKVPQCPPEKEEAIEAALKHFRMID